MDLLLPLIKCCKTKYNNTVNECEYNNKKENRIDTLNKETVSQPLCVYIRIHV